MEISPNMCVPRLCGRLLIGDFERGAGRGRPDGMNLTRTSPSRAGAFSAGDTFVNGTPRWVVFFARGGQLGLLIIPGGLP